MDKQPQDRDNLLQLRQELASVAAEYHRRGMAIVFCDSEKNPNINGSHWEKHHHPDSRPPTEKLAVTVTSEVVDESGAPAKRKIEREIPWASLDGSFHPDRIPLNARGLGCVTGWQSIDGVVCIDFETDGEFRAFCLSASLEDGLANVIDACPVARTPSGGAHLFIRPDVSDRGVWLKKAPRPELAEFHGMLGGQKLAKPADPVAFGRTDKIETRGRNGFIALPASADIPSELAACGQDQSLLAPAVDALLGTPKARKGRFWVRPIPEKVSDWPVVSQFELGRLLSMARLRNECPKFAKTETSKAVKAVRSATKSFNRATGSDLWSRAGVDPYWIDTAVSLLESAGWTLRSTGHNQWDIRHPGPATNQKSGTFGELMSRDTGAPLLYAWSGSGLPIETSLSAAQIVAWLRHNGDMKTMHRDLVAHYSGSSTVRNLSGRGMVDPEKLKKQHEPRSEAGPAGEHSGDQAEAGPDDNHGAQDFHHEPAGCDNSEVRPHELEPISLGYHLEHEDNPSLSRLGLPYSYLNGKRLRQYLLSGIDAVDGNNIAKIVAAAGGSIYSRDGVVVGVTMSDGGASVKLSTLNREKIKPMVDGYLVTATTRTAKKDGRTERWHEIIPLSPNLCSTLANSHALWPDMPEIYDIPVLLEDGSVLAKPGIYADRGIIVSGDHKGVASLPKPSQESFEKLARLVKNFLAKWDFIDHARAEAWFISALATLLFRQRANVRNAPLFLVQGAKTESGKSSLCQAVSRIATGRPMGEASWPKDNIREAEAALIGAIDSGRSTILFDNLENHSVLQNAVIDATITGTGKQMRRFHATDLVSTPPSGMVLFANGNQVAPVADTANRTLTINLGSRPLAKGIGSEEARLEDQILAARGEIVSTMLSAWLAFEEEGCPQLCSERCRLHAWSVFADFAARVTGHDLMHNRSVEVIAQDGRVKAAGELAEIVLELQPYIKHAPGRNRHRIPDGYWSPSLLAALAKQIDDRNDKDQHQLVGVPVDLRQDLARCLATSMGAFGRSASGRDTSHGYIVRLGFFASDIIDLCGEIGFTTPAGDCVKLSKLTNSRQSGSVYTFVKQQEGGQE